MNFLKLHYQILFCFLSLFIISCQKKIDNLTKESQGINFNKLLKTVTKNFAGTGANYISTYEYNANGELSVLTRNYSDLSGNTSTQTDTYYRNASNRLDSIGYKVISNPQGTAFQNYYITEFHYGNGGNISYTLNKSLTSYSDSCVYLYQGGRLTQRMQYRKAKGSANFQLLVSYNYTYDASGNLALLNSTWATPVTTKIFTYTYDKMPNTLPVMEYENELFGFWTKAFDNNYTNANNLRSRRCNVPGDWDWSEKDFEYKYSTNNKALYQKVMQTNTSQFYEVFYFYD